MKAKWHIFFVSFLLLAILLFTCVSEKEEIPKNLSEKKENRSWIAENEEKIKENYSDVVCENCHLNPKRQYVPQADRIQGHVNGSGYCVFCHAKGEDVVKAIGDLHHSRFKDCIKCHPTFSPKDIKCGNCHGYPDPFKESGGNLLKIHLSRGFGCKECHGHDFLRIHIQKKKFPERFNISGKFS